MAQDENGTIPLAQQPTDTDHTVKADFSDVPTVSATRPTLPVDFDVDAVAPASPLPPTQSTNHVALPRGYALLEYTIEAVLGVGGFGITYLAQDNNLQCRVAIKEYLPNDLAVRTAGQTVIPRTDSDTHGYHVGLDRFLAEARVLATFRHHNIVRVGRFFEANQTAYMVMDYEQGESLRSWIESHGPADEAMLLGKMLPLLEGLETVHKAGIVHRDIKPANIYVRDSDGSLVLLDFGAARQTTGVSSKSLTSIITPGYAPFEQYHARGAQGPWTDLYALGGVLYWLVTGQKPIEAPSRVKDDPLVPAVTAAAGRFGATFLRAIDWALTVDEGQRPHSVAEFRAVLTGAAPIPAKQAPPAATVAAAATRPEQAPAPGKSGAGLKYALAGGALAIAAALAILVARPGEKPAAQGVPNVAEATPPATAPVPTAALQDASKARPVAETRQPAAAKAAAAHSTPAKQPPVAAASPPKSAAIVAKPEVAGHTALLTFQIVPSGESAELVIDDRSVGRVPPLREFRLPAGKHKVELVGTKPPGVYYYWVDLAPNEKKNLWARFSND